MAQLVLLTDPFHPMFFSSWVWQKGACRSFTLSIIQLVWFPTLSPGAERFGIGHWNTPYLEQATLRIWGSDVIQRSPKPRELDIYPLECYFQIGKYVGYPLMTSDPQILSVWPVPNKEVFQWPIPNLSAPGGKVGNQTSCRAPICSFSLNNQKHGHLMQMRDNRASKCMVLKVPESLGVVSSAGKG